MTTALLNYQTRMQRVLDHIDQHLDAALDLETISAIAAFSRFHFHRQFAATFGMSAHRYVQLARLKRAAQRLTGPGASSVTQAALEAGYDAPDAFARAFRQRVGQSPSSFRKSPDWAAWIAAFAPLDLARTKLMQITFEPHDVIIRDLPPTPVWAGALRPAAPVGLGCVACAAFNYQFTFISAKQRATPEGDIRDVAWN